MKSYNILYTIMSWSSLIFWGCHFCTKSRCYHLLLIVTIGCGIYSTTFPVFFPKRVSSLTLFGKSMDSPTLRLLLTLYLVYSWCVVTTHAVHPTVTRRSCFSAPLCCSKFWNIHRNRNSEKASQSLLKVVHQHLSKCGNLCENCWMETWVHSIVLLASQPGVALKCWIYNLNA